MNMIVVCELNKPVKQKHLYLHRDLGSIKVSFEILARLLKISSGGSNDIHDGEFQVFRLYGGERADKSMYDSLLWQRFDVGFSFLVTLLLEISFAKMTSGSLVFRTSSGE